MGGTSPSVRWISSEVCHSLSPVSSPLTSFDGFRTRANGASQTQVVARCRCCWHCSIISRDIHSDSCKLQTRWLSTIPLMTLRCSYARTSVLPSSSGRRCFTNAHRRRQASAADAALVNRDETAQLAYDSRRLRRMFGKQTRTDLIRFPVYWVMTARLSCFTSRQAAPRTDRAATAGTESI